MRTCIRCDKDKEDTEFWRCKRCKDGIDFVCADCRRQAKLEKSNTPFGRYSARCRALTTVVAHCCQSQIGPKPGPNYQLDHRFSIRSGFDAGIPIEEICQPGNLEWLPKSQNLGKGRQCSIDRYTLNRLGTVTPQIREIARLLEKIEAADKLLEINIIAAAKYRTKDNGQ